MIRLAPPVGKQHEATGQVVSYGSNYYARITDENGRPRDHGAYILKEYAEGAVRIELRRLARKPARRHNAGEVP